MKKSRKGLFPSIAALLALSLALGACASTPPAAPAESPASTQAQAATDAPTTATEEPAAELPPYEAVWYSPSDRSGADNDLVMAEIAKVLSHTNTTLKMNYIPWSEFPDKMSMVIASGDNYDYTFMAPWTNYYQNVAKGAFADLTEAYETKLPKLKAIMVDDLINGSKVKGKIYGLPTVKESAAGYGFDIDKEYAAQIGLDVASIKSYEDLEPYLKLAKEQIPDVVPYFERTESQLSLNIYYDIIIDPRIPAAVRLGDTTEMKVVNQFETQEQMDTWKLINRWYNLGYTNPNPATTTEETAIINGTMFARGGGNLGPAPEWMGPAGRTISRAYIGVSTSTSSTCNATVCISSNVKDLDRALLFFDEIATDPVAHNLLVAGIEGKHYRVVDATTNPVTIDNLEGQTGQTVGYLSGGAWSLGGDFFSTILYTSDSKTRNEDIKVFNDSADSSPVLGFSVDTEPISTEIAACQNVYAELGNGLGTGVLDPEVYGPQFIEKLKSAGSDNIIEEVQRQVDIWRADNNK
jgi:putative aldouronate transport system substrate-binding protein